MKLAIGLIETIGLVTAIQAADAAQKSADVALLGMENSRGGGQIVVKLVGDVSAVVAAVESAVKAAEEIGKVYAYKVISRPSDELEKFLEPKEPNQEQIPAEAATAICKVQEDSVCKEPVNLDVVPQDEASTTRVSESAGVTCNLCGDPECPRKSGESHRKCIHY